MGTPAYSLNVPAYNPYNFNAAPAYQSPYGNFKPKLTPEDMNRQNSIDAAKAQSTVNQGLTQDRNEFQGNTNAYGGMLGNVYADQINGQWGMDPTRENQFLDLQGLGTFNPTAQMGDWRGDTGNMVANYNQGVNDTRGAANNLVTGLYDAVDPLGQAYDDQINSMVSNYWDKGQGALDENNAAIQGYLDSITKGAAPGGPWTSGGGMSLYSGGYGGFSGGGAGLGSASVGNVDMSGLDIPPEFIADYTMSPEKKQALINLNMQGAGGRYRAGLEQAQQAMAASGIANPYADATMRERYNMREGQAMDDARVAALVGGDNAAAERLFNVENLRSGNERTRAGLNTNIATTNAQLQDSSLGRQFSAGENSANRSFQAQMAAADKAAEMERFYKELAQQGNIFATQTTAGMGDRNLGFIGDATGFEAGQRNTRESQLSDRGTNAATVGYGSQLQNEQGLLNYGQNLYGNIASGTQDVYNNINSTGLDYSNAKSGRYGNVIDYNNAQRQAGVAGAQGMYDTNMAARQNTWGNQISNNANQGQNANQAIGQLGTYKATKPGFMNSFVAPLMGGIGQGIGSAVTGGAGK